MANFSPWSVYLQVMQESIESKLAPLSMAWDRLWVWSFMEIAICSIASPGPPRIRQRRQRRRAHRAPARLRDVIDHGMMGCFGCHAILCNKSS